MAQPSTELNRFRERTTRLLDDLNRINDALAPIEGAAETDAERLAFFADAITAAGDVTSAEVGAAVTALRCMQTWLDDNIVTLYKMRI
jgi:hypothetical protein